MSVTTLLVVLVFITVGIIIMVHGVRVMIHDDVAFGGIISFLGFAVSIGALLMSAV